MFQKKGMDKVFSTHRMMVVTTILVEWMGHNGTPIPHQTTHATTLKKRKQMNLCQWRSLSCWSLMHPIYQHWTLMMQTLSGRCSLAWLMMTINHCQRTFQHLLMKERSQHNSFPAGSILGVASTALKVEGRTRHA